MIKAFFATFEIPPPPPREHAKRRRGRAEDEARAWKKEHREMEVARRASPDESKRVSGFWGTEPISLLIVPALRPRFALPTTLVFHFFMHWGKLHVFLLGVG